ncbi:MAG: hypothetical protein FJY75_02190 [Candidatus Eisenbacteria bacterium]|uniref:T9SS type A sorting domain-containing protein n=1 Tax=Eiseniibacteriota bacterium TaxID=2212470 RepID=A0A938BMX9_UNCEI|nr:hypothetical protein [Candidatus Eisenbacteria bacterium]
MIALMRSAVSRLMHTRASAVLPVAALLVTLFAAFLIGVQPASAVPPEFSPPAFVPGDADLGLAASDQHQAAISKGDGLSLVVWSDLRSNRAGYDIYGARLDAQGTLLDPLPIPILLDGSGQTVPQVAWNGTHWLVVALDQAHPVGTEPRLRGVRVSPQGEVLDEEPILISEHAGTYLTLASDGSGWAVFWSGTTAGNAAARGARISAAGGVLDPGGRVVLPETYFMRSVLSAAFAGGRYLLAYNESSSIAGVLLTPALDPAGPNAFTIFSGSYPTRLASSGSGFLACAAAPGWYVFHDIIATRITTAGQVLDTPPLLVAGQATWGAVPDAAFDGGRWIVAWDHPGIRAARVGTDGVVLDPGGVAIDESHPSSHGAPRLAPAAGGGAQLVWADDRFYFLDVFTTRLNPDLAADPATGISSSAPAQTLPRMASDGSTTMLVFKSTVDGESRILATLLDAAGNFLLAEPMEVATSGEVYTSGPAVACDGERFLVVWTPGGPGQNRVYGRRFLADGTPLDPAPIFIMNGLEPDAAGLDGEFLVVGTHGPGYPQHRLVYSIRMRGSDGAVLGPPAQTSDVVGDSYAMHPRVAAFGDRWLVVWQGRWTHDNPWARIRANFVSAAGVAGTNFVAADGQSAGRFYSYAPAVAVGGGTALITFESTANGSCCWDLYGCRFDANGTRLDAYEGDLLLASAGDQTASAVAWDGEQFLILFHDRRHAASTADLRPDIFGLRVQADGTVLDPGGFEIAVDDVPETWPAVLGTATGRVGGASATIAYAVLVPEAPYAAERVVVRFAGPLVAGVSDVAALGGARLYPNPSAGRVHLEIPASGPANEAWGVFDIAGRLSGLFAAGLWDGRDLTGRAVAPGIYFARPMSAQQGPRVKLIRW